MERILNALDIVDPTKADILTEIKTYSDNLKFKLINYTEFNNHLDEMVRADEALSKLLKENADLQDYYTKGLIKAEWDKTMLELAKLQGLIILRKVTQKDCDGLIKSLLNAFNLKINAVNNILSSDLKDNSTPAPAPTPDPNPTSDPNSTPASAPVVPFMTMMGGSNDEHYRLKYLKYKGKYLNLLKNNF